MCIRDRVEIELDQRIAWLEAQTAEASARTTASRMPEHLANRWQEAVADPRWTGNEMPLRNALTDPGLHELSTEEIFNLVLVKQPEMFPRPEGMSIEMREMIDLGRRVVESNYDESIWHRDQSEEVH